MGKRNYLIEGVSGTGKSSVCRELRRRGYAAVDGDNELAYQGEPQTGEKTVGFGHEHHIWDVEKVRRLAANEDDEAYAARLDALPDPDVKVYRGLRAANDL